MKLKTIFCIAMLHLFVSSNSLALERLFLTPAERAQLDALRYRLVETKTTVPFKDVGHIKLNGMVLRKSRENTLWINDSVYPSSDRGANYAIKFDNVQKNNVPIKVDGHISIRLRPGQVFDPTDSTVRDVYQKETPKFKTHMDTAGEEQGVNLKQPPLSLLKTNVKKPESFASVSE